MERDKRLHRIEERHLESPLRVTRHGVHISCPECKGRKTYRLADGRRKCARCRKKFTPRARKPRIPRETLKELVRLFWLMVPAERAARDLGINRKTALRHYTRLRALLLAECQAETEPMQGEVEVDESYFGGYRKGIRGRGAAGKIPVFGLLKRKGAVHVVFPARLDQDTLHREIQDHVVPQSWVYSDGYKAYDKLDLKGFRHVRIDHSKTLGRARNHINGIENFWGFAKRRLKMYHGGWKRNFRLFLKELEFRFNHRDDPDVLDLLTRRALAGPA
jgi:transposase